MRGPKYRVLQNIMRGKVACKSSPDQIKVSWLNNLRDWCGVVTNMLFRVKTYKIKIAMMITIILKGQIHEEDIHPDNQITSSSWKA